MGGQEDSRMSVAMERLITMEVNKIREGTRIEQKEKVNVLEHACDMLVRCLILFICGCMCVRVRERWESERE